MNITDLLNPESDDELPQTQQQQSQTQTRQQQSQIQTRQQQSQIQTRLQQSQKQTQRENIRLDIEKPRPEQAELSKRLSSPEIEMIINFLSCQRCGNILTDPTTLSCGNTYCRGCLTSVVTYHIINPLLTSSAARVICPNSQCGRRHVISDIKSDVTIQKLVDLCRKEICPFVPAVRQRQRRKRRRSICSDETDEDDDPIPDTNFNYMDNCESSEEDDEGSIPNYEIGEGSRTTIANTPVTYSPLTSRTINPDQIKAQVLQELDCQVCFLLYIDPVTTACGHTFCKTCLTRSLDHSDKCPLCRSQLRLSYTQVNNHLNNKLITDFLEKLYPNLYADRRMQVENELLDDMEDTPIFVCSLVFPKMPCFLHVFEPRYRLMLRRCLDSRKRHFGMVLPGRDGQSGYSEYGTMLEIQSAEFLPDGRSLVETVGSYRFRVVDRKQKDGYHVGKIERIDDISLEEEEELEQQSIAAAVRHNSNPANTPVNEPTTAELIGTARGFIESLRDTPWLLQRLNSTYGEMPDDPSDFSFWVASVIPIDEHDKRRLLELRSVRERLKLIVYWVGQLQDQWWFTRGCSIS